MKKLLYLAAAATALTACNNNGVPKHKMDIAIRNCNRYYAYIQKGQPDSTVQLFTDAFRACTNPVTFLDSIKDHIGSITKKRLQQTEYSTEFKNSTRTKTIRLTYEVNYTSGYVAKETFTILDDGDTTEKINALAVD